MTHQDMWTIAEQRDGHILPVSFELLARGRILADKVGAELSAVVLGSELAPAGVQELIYRGADRVLVAEHSMLAQFLVEPHAACLSWLIGEYEPAIIIAGATSTGRTLMPYVAVQVNAGLTADCTVLDLDPDTGELLQTRPAIGGNILATIRTPVHRPQMATVRPHSMRPAASDPSRKGLIQRLSVPEAALTSRVSRAGFVASGDELHLQDAEIVVTVGRGIKRAENIPVVQELADTLGGALGATREVVDRGWLSYPHQVGLSGKTVTPKLYVAVGVSGSVQHLAGMQTAETIIAINNDPDAQIFRVADLGIVGDLFEVVPVLTAALRQLKDTEWGRAAQPRGGVGS